MSDERIATPSQTVGPFFHFGMTTALGQAAAAVEGERISIAVRVLDGDGAPLDDAVLEYWHTTAGDRAARCGRAATNKAGACAIDTIQPSGHVNICLFARGLLRQVYTRIYFPDDAHGADAVLSLVPEARRGTLVAAPDGPGRWRFDIHLQGPKETVFFDQ